MIDYYLKFSSAQEAFDVFKEAGYTSQDEEGKEFVIPATLSYCIDLVGTITKGGKWEYENEQLITVEEPIVIDGYHVNVRILKGEISDNLKPFIIESPQTPYRIFG